MRARGDLREKTRAPAAAPADEQKKMRPVTAFGRYAKVLLSSNEFVFVS